MTPRFSHLGEWVACKVGALDKTVKFLDTLDLRGLGHLGGGWTHTGLSWKTEQQDSI